MRAESLPRVRITLVGPLPPPPGGMANQTRQLAELLRGAGAEVSVVRTNPPYRPEWIGRVRGVRALFRLLPYTVALWHAIGRSELVHVMANSGWSWHLFAAPAVWIGSLRHKAVVVNYRGGEAARFFARSWTLVRPSLKRARAVIVPSSFLESVFREYEQATIVVPNIVDLRRFRPRRETPRPGARRASPRLLVTRNLEPIYDIETAIRAFARIRESYSGARLTVAGEGPERNRLEALTAELSLGATVRFTGSIDNAGIESLYDEADLLLNPSLADNMPISILEALASGVPVVATNVGGIPHLLRDGETALLVEPGDPDQMAAKASRLLDDERLASDIVANGLELVRQFEWQSVRRRLFEVYRLVLPPPVGESLAPRVDK